MLGPQWTIAGMGDFNGDGKADVLLENTSTVVVGDWITGSGSWLGLVCSGRSGRSPERAISPAMPTAQRTCCWKTQVRVSSAHGSPAAEIGRASVYARAEVDDRRNGQFRRPCQRHGGSCCWRTRVRVLVGDWITGSGSWQGLGVLAPHVDDRRNGRFQRRRHSGRAVGEHEYRRRRRLDYRQRKLAGPGNALCEVDDRRRGRFQWRRDRRRAVGKHEHEPRRRCGSPTPTSCSWERFLRTLPIFADGLMPTPLSCTRRRIDGLLGYSWRRRQSRSLGSKPESFRSPAGSFRRDFLSCVLHPRACGGHLHREGHFQPAFSICDPYWRAKREMHCSCFLAMGIRINRSKRVRATHGHRRLIWRPPRLASLS